MLLELRAENYAVIDHAVAEFGPGLNLLTGETGAGKSILIDALALLLGGKASSDVVRFGAEKAVLGCVFESTPGAEEILEENGIDPEGDEILLRREIAGSGKGRVFVNNQPATVGVLRQLAPELALVHAQSETLVAFDAAQQRILLDRFGDVSSEEVGAAFGRWKELEGKIQELRSVEQDRLRLMDLWSFQAKEIASAEIADAEEDIRLETEKRVLANSERGRRRRRSCCMKRRFRQRRCWVGRCGTLRIWRSLMSSSGRRRRNWRRPRPASRMRRLRCGILRGR
jgi:DNA repair protein RecN (Recombination protein N)